jgi:serine/threonine protein kinase
MNNGSLSKYLNGKKKLSLEEKFNIIYDICHGMIFLHSKSTPIIHRGSN